LDSEGELLGLITQKADAGDVLAMAATALCDGESAGEALTRTKGATSEAATIGRPQTEPEAEIGARLVAAMAKQIKDKRICLKPHFIDLDPR
jgi:hypothetical protein